MTAAWSEGMPPSSVRCSVQLGDSGQDLDGRPEFTTRRGLRYDGSLSAELLWILPARFMSARLCSASVKDEAICSVNSVMTDYMAFRTERPCDSICVAISLVPERRESFCSARPLRRVLCGS